VGSPKALRTLASMPCRLWANHNTGPCGSETGGSPCRRASPPAAGLRPLVMSVILVIRRSPCAPQRLPVSDPQRQSALTAPAHAGRSRRTTCSSIEQTPRTNTSSSLRGRRPRPDTRTSLAPAPRTRRRRLGPDVRRTAGDPFRRRRAQRADGDPFRAKFQRNRFVVLDHHAGPVNTSLRRSGLNFRIDVFPDVTVAHQSIADHRAASRRLSLRRQPGSATATVPAVDAPARLRAPDPRLASRPSRTRAPMPSVPVHRRINR
jgi:hypothetical protein